MKIYSNGYREPDHETSSDYINETSNYELCIFRFNKSKGEASIVAIYYEIEMVHLESDPSRSMQHKFHEQVSYIACHLSVNF